MNFFLVTILFFLSINCSFDNKTGIWKNENTINKKDNKLFEDFDEIVLSESSYNKIINLEKNFSFNLDSPKSNNDWTDIYYSKNNNLNN